MMTPPLARVLRDFGALTGRAPALPARNIADAPGAVPRCSDSDTEALSARLAEAYRKGEEAGRAAVCSGHEQELAGLRENMAARLVEERERWTTEEGDRLAAELKAGIDEVEIRIAAQLANILAPFLSTKLCEAMVQDVSALISKMLSTGKHVQLRISGPEDLLDRVRDMLGPMPPRIEWEVNDKTDICVSVDETLIETDIERWLRRFPEGSE